MNPLHPWQPWGADEPPAPLAYAYATDIFIPADYAFSALETIRFSSNELYNLLSNSNANMPDCVVYSTTLVVFW